MSTAFGQCQLTGGIFLGAGTFCLPRVAGTLPLEGIAFSLAFAALMPAGGGLKFLVGISFIGNALTSLLSEFDEVTPGETDGPPAELGAAFAALFTF